MEALKGRRGTGSLYLISDLLVATIVFGLLYVGTNNYLMNNARNFSSGTVGDVDDLMNDRVTPPWHLIPVGFIIACIFRSVYGRSWMSDVKGLVSWVFVVSSLFILNLIYISLDNYVLNTLPDLINGIIPRADDFLTNMIFPLWNNLLWLVTLALLFYSIINISRTPEGEYADSYM